MRVTFFHYFFYDKIFFSQLKQVQIFVTKNVNNNFDTCFSTYIRVVCFVVIFFFIKKNINTLYEICFQISAVCFMQLWKKGCMRLIRFLATIFVVDFAALLEKIICTVPQWNFAAWNATKSHIKKFSMALA